jgi:site-specific DNA-methyltransferase (adenine-specific)
LSKYDIIVKPRHHNIIEKIKKKKCLDSLYNSSGYFKVRTNDKRLNDTGATKCYVSSLKSKKRYKFIDNYENTNNFWKVITPRAAFGAYSGFGYKQISNPNEIYTDSYISFRVDNKSQAESLLSYLNTTFVNYLLSVRKISQDISKNTCKWIALVPLNKIWSNEEVYDYFKLTKGEIKFIESSI